MKNTRGIALLVLFAVGLLSYGTFMGELLSVRRFVADLEVSENKGLPEGSATLDKAKDDRKFAKSEYKGADKRRNKVVDELILLTGLSVVASMFLSKFIRKQVMKVANLPIGLIKGTAFGVESTELNFLSIFLTLNMALIFSRYLLDIFSGQPRKILRSAVSLVILFVLAIPLILVLLFKLFRAYGCRIIIACYLAYFIKAGVEFGMQTPVDMSEMEKVPMSEFSSAVQDLLISRGLESRVYKEIKPSKSINAALVGWGNQERIEIYGDHTGFNDDEFESVLLHEIGHSINNSLVRKIVVLFFLKLIELGILLFLYAKVSHAFADESITKDGAFIAIGLIYLGFVARWILIGHKLTSQGAETAADLVAKEKGYGESLSNVLYKICIGGKEYLRGTVLFNTLMSYHPTAYNRIEYLSEGES